MEQGSILMQEGERGREAFVVVDGLLEVARSGSGSIAASIQGRRRPSRERVRSERSPAIGSAIASHSLEPERIRLITAGDISRTSVA